MEKENFEFVMPLLDLFGEEVIIQRRSFGRRPRRKASLDGKAEQLSFIDVLELSDEELEKLREQDEITDDYVDWLRSYILKTTLRQIKHPQTSQENKRDGMAWMMITRSASRSAVTQQAPIMRMSARPYSGSYTAKNKPMRGKPLVGFSLSKTERKDSMDSNPFQGLPMPEYDGPEPTEIDLRRIQKMIDDGQFDELSKPHQRWVTHRLMPSLARFGAYPPPTES